MDNNQIWQKVLTELELNTSRASFVTWLQNTSLVSRENGIATISVPSAFSKEWLENKFNKLVLKFLRDTCLEIKEIQYVISQNQPEAAKTNKKKKTEEMPNELQQKFAEFTVDPKTNLNPRYVFDSFVVGSSNEMANAAAQSIIKNPGFSYNPLFIYGGVGLGKTHLIQAIGNKIKQNNPNSNIVYLSSEKFTNDVVESIRNNSIDRLKDEYRKKDVLIIDDIQFISGKEKTQEEFFHTFNSLYEKNKQIIISSDRTPKSLPLLEERLKSRFEGGMIADIGFPDYEMRMAILKNKIQERRLNTTEEVLNYLAVNVQKNIRELEGALNIIQTKFPDQEINNLNQIQKILHDFIKSPKKSVSLKHIIKTVCDFYDLEEEHLFEKNRKREISKPRQIIMYFLREELRYSFPYIGQKIGNRDHTTALHAYVKVKKDIENNITLQEEINLLKQKIYS